MADQNIKVNINLDLTEFNKNAKAMSDALSNVLGKDVKMFAAEMNKAEASINGAEKAMKGATTAATKTGNSVKQSNIQWHNLSLIVQDLPFGFRGIQNNLPALGQSIAGFAGPAMFAFSAVIAAITAFDMGLFGAKKKTKELKDETDSLIDSMSQEATRVNSLLAVLANENETRERKNRAIKELQKINPDIFKGLKLETDGVRDLNKFYNAYIENLKNAILLKQDELELQKLVKEDLKRKPVLGALPKTDPLATGKKLLEETNGILRLVDNNTGKIDNKNKSIITSLGEENKRLATKQEILDRIAKRSGSVELAPGTTNTNTGPKPTVSKVYEDLAQEEFNFYKDSIFRAEEYFVKLNNIQKINALMEATIRGASLDELFTIQQTYEQKELNFRKSIEDKKFAIRQQSDERQKQLTKANDDARLKAEKDLTDKSIYYTSQRIKAVNIEADASIRANRGNYQAQKQALEEAIVKLGVFRMAGIGGAQAMLTLDEAIGNNKAKIEGLVDPLETLNQTLQSTFNQLNIDMLTAFGEQLGELMSGKEFDFTKLGTILADALSSIGKALIAYAVTNGAVAELFKNPGTWPAALVAGIAAVAAGSALKNKLSDKKATAFANGGIVSGPTMGLVGEYPGAQNNPEVIAPLDKLKSMIGGGGGGTFVLRGQDLLLATNRAQKASNLKGQNISLA
jgi:hypothetical protein